jgi:tryptophan 2,3-dioxygenase
MVVVLGGAMFLAWLALRIVGLGASMITWSAEDRQTVERFIRASLGRGGEPPPVP